MSAYDPVLVEAMTNYIRDIRTGAPPWSRRRETPTESDHHLGLVALALLAQHGVDLTESRSRPVAKASTVDTTTKEN